jgi:hypothetical protein
MPTPMNSDTSVNSDTSGPFSAAADGLSATAERAKATASGVAHTAADALSSTADYVREHDVKSMLGDLLKLARNNPGPALLTAAVMGFFVARAFSKD